MDKILQGYKNVEEKILKKKKEKKKCLHETKGIEGKMETRKMDNDI